MFLKDSDPLLCDFTDLRKKKGDAKPAEQYEAIPYPFQHQMEKWGKGK